MRVFVTGATGFIGSAIAVELRRRGHEIVALARSESAANSLLDAGFGVHRGDIKDPPSIATSLSQVDAVIHAAFDHDFSRYLENCEADGRLLAALARALEGSNKILVATSTTIVTPTGEIATEDLGAVDQIPRSASERFLLYADRGVQTSVVRLPPSVYGLGDTAFVPALIDLARQNGTSVYIGKGTNHWPGVHRDDAARLFCDVIEQPRPGARYHAVAENGIPFRTIAEAIAEGLGVTAATIPNDQAEKQFGWLAPFAAIDNPTSSEWTRRTTGWAPREQTLIETMHDAGYFDTRSR